MAAVERGHRVVFYYDAIHRVWVAVCQQCGWKSLATSLLAAQLQGSIHKQESERS